MFAILSRSYVYLGGLGLIQLPIYGFNMQYALFKLKNNGHSKIY